MRSTAASARWDADAARLVFVGHEANRTGDLYAVENGACARKTGINDGFLQAHYVAEAKYIPFTNSDGVKIDGWLLAPQDVDPAKKYPAVLEIHGGPRCAYGTVFYHEMQALAGAGISCSSATRAAATATARRSPTCAASTERWTIAT